MDNITHTLTALVPARTRRNGDGALPLPAVVARKRLLSRDQRERFPVVDGTPRPRGYIRRQAGYG